MFGIRKLITEHRRLQIDALSEPLRSGSARARASRRTAFSATDHPEFLHMVRATWVAGRDVWDGNVRLRDAGRACLRAAELDARIVDDALVAPVARRDREPALERMSNSGRIVAAPRPCCSNGPGSPLTSGFRSILALVKTFSVSTSVTAVYLLE